MEFVVLGTVLFAFGYYFIVKPFLMKLRRKKTMEKPFFQEYEEILLKNVEQYALLPEQLQNQLKKLVNVFLDEKVFEGCEGLQLTDEIKVTIAGQACMLLLNRNTDFYKHLKTIMVYPAAFSSKSPYGIGGSIGYKKIWRTGESWLRGPVVLSWDSVKKGSKNSKDGQNVVFHEFAHQLDQEDGKSDGVPTLKQWSAYRLWGQVFSKQYFNLQRKTKNRKKYFIDKYGATNPAEFFAVATETFFEKPNKMKLEAPDLYKQLSEFYKINPLKWGKE